MGLAFKFVDSPVGRLKLVASEKGLVAVLWDGDRPERVVLHAMKADEGHPWLVETERQLAEYFAGDRRSFDLPLDMRGTPFQVQVWTALLEIPFGETRTYSQMARQVGQPGASRAVGAANGRNPLSIVAPCHRVVGSTGKLTGFAGGLQAKAMLLRMEGSVLSLFP